MSKASESSQPKNLFRDIKRSFKYFCENTSINGLRYIVEDNINWIQRAAWILVFLCGVAFSTYFCVEMWQRWEESPVLMSVDTNRYPLKNVPFPAVTICNVNKVSKEKLLKVLHQDPRYGNISYDVMQSTLRYMTKLDRAINNKKELRNLNRLYQSANISANDLFQILKNTSQSCMDLVADCVWLGLPSPCMEFVTALPTDDGICCTFNPDSYIDHELGIKYSRKNVLTVSGNGYRMGLALTLDARLDDYSVTNGKFDGFKVLVHASDDFPDVNDRGFVIGPGSETFVAVKGITSFNTEEVAKKVPPAKRQCEVQEEHTLLYFPRYSRAACTVECTTKLMKDTCNCRPYFFRDISAADNRTRLCEFDSYNCISDVYESVRNNGDELCHHCLPPCTDVWYEPEISYAPFPGRGFNLTRTYKRLVKDLNLTAQMDGNEYLKTNVAVLHVYYKEKTGMSYKIDIRFGVEDLISAIGGLLGLGLGVSFISLIELASYLIMTLTLVFYHNTSSTKNDEKEISNFRAKGNDTPSTSTITTNCSSI